MAKRDKDADPHWSIFKHVKFVRITMLALIILIFCGISFICSYWKDEGTLGEGIIRNFFADILIIYQYPGVVLFYHSGFYNWGTYVLGLVIDCYLYAIALRIIAKIIFKIRKSKEPAEAVEKYG